MKAVLHVTGGCNLRCRYCYVGDKTAARMPPEIARAAVDLVAAQTDRRFTVSFMGGEPLLEYDLIRGTVEHAEQVAREKKLGVSFRMTTNGLLFDEERLAWCRRHRVIFALSLDGDAQSHDANRVNAAGRGSHAQLMERLDAIQRRSLVLIVIAVVTPRTASNLGPAMTFLFEHGIDKVILSPDFGGEWDRATLRRLQHGYEQVAERYIERHRQGEEIYFSAFDEKIRTHALGPVRRGVICDMGANSFSVAPSGEIYPCVQFVRPETDLRFRIGDARAGFDSSRRRALVEMNRKPRPGCEGCDLDGRCNNWCGCVNHRTTGDVLEVPPFLCEHERMLMPIADRVGNVLHDERNEIFRRKFYQDHLEPH
ncbi:MAG: radical SAM protein [Myxococcota bacterium]|nr:radical SAM protein [Myxococcota bacterium]